MRRSFDSSLHHCSLPTEAGREFAEFGKFYVDMRQGARYRQSRYRMSSDYREAFFASLKGPGNAAKIRNAWLLFEPYAKANIYSSRSPMMSWDLFERLLSPLGDNGGRAKDLARIARWAEHQYQLRPPSIWEKVLTSEDDPLASDVGTDAVLSLVEEAEQHLGGPDQEWMGRIEREQTGIEAALQNTDPILRLRIVAALRRYWYARSRFSEGSEKIKAALNGCPDGGLVRAKALAGLAAYLCVQANLEEAREVSREALDILATSSLRDDPVAIATAAEAHNVLGIVAHHRGEPVVAEREFFQSRDLYRNSGASEWLLVNVTNNVGAALIEQDRHEEAERICQDNADHADEIGYTHGQSVALTNQAAALIYLQSWGKAQLVCKHGLELQKKGTRPKAHSLINLGIVQTELDRFGEAARSFLQSLEILRGLNEWRIVTDVVGEIGALLCRSGDHHNAVQLWASASRVREKLKCPLPGNEARRIEGYVLQARRTLGDEVYDDHAYAGRSIAKGELIKIATNLCRALIAR